MTLRYLKCGFKGKIRLLLEKFRNLVSTMLFFIGGHQSLSYPLVNKVIHNLLIVILFFYITLLISIDI